MRPDDLPFDAWVWGYYPNERAAIDAYNKLYPEGARSGIIGRVEPDGDRFRLDLRRTVPPRRKADR